jgi:hypothetical protein
MSIADKEVGLEAVKQSGHALGFASAELKADKEVVLVAVKQDGRALGFASAELKADKEVVLVAVKQNGHALQFASTALREGGLMNYIESAFATYTVPVPLFQSTFLFVSKQSSSFSQDSASSSQPRRPRLRSLQVINGFGLEGAEHIKKVIAAYAGVQCMWLYGLPFSWHTIAEAKLQLEGTQEV